MENQVGFAVHAGVTQSTGEKEREAAVPLCREFAGSGRATPGADGDFDPADSSRFVER